MGDRGRLHKNQRENFLEWAAQEGYIEEPVKGQYEAFRVRKKGQAPHIFFERNEDVHKHYTVQNRSFFLIRQFLQYKKIDKRFMYAVVTRKKHEKYEAEVDGVGVFLSLAKALEVARQVAKTTRVKKTVGLVYKGKVGQKFKLLHEIEDKEKSEEAQR